MKRIALVFIISIISVSFSYGQIVKKTPKTEGVDLEIYKMTKALDLVMDNYVDSVDKQKLVEDAIIGMLKELDPHSNYFTKEGIDRANESLKGKFNGIGVTYQIIEDTAVVIGVIEEGPSEKAGIKAGDKIIKVNEEVAVGDMLNTKWLSKRLRGEKETEVEITIIRPFDKKQHTYTIIRDVIPINSLDLAYMVTEQTGYIRLNKFARTTMSEFNTAIKQLDKDGMENLILDLRGNSGGYLFTAIALADQFLSKGETIVITRGENYPEKVDVATRRGEFKKGRLVILIDEGSASASEIVTGAVQDWDRGLVIGRRSFGKGLVQKPYQLNDGSVIRLTVARYYTPTGRCIQRAYDDGKDEYYKSLRQRMATGELLNPDSVDFPDSLMYSTPNGRTVYGGGGIMPDVFIPVDTSGQSDYYKTIVRKNLFNRYVLRVLEQNRAQILEKYPTAEELMASDFEVDTYMKDFIAFVDRKGIEMVQEDFEKSNYLIERALSESFVRHLYGFSEIYRFRSTYDPVMLKAIQLIENDSTGKDFNLSMK